MTPAPPSREPLWVPSVGSTRTVALHRFAQVVEQTHHVEVGDYNSLWEWSVSEIEAFWATLWKFYGLDRISGYERVLAEDSMPGAVWFPGAHVNFASYLLAQGEPDDIAIVSSDETGAVTRITRAELRRQVGSLAHTLRELGVAPGSVVVGYLPNIAEAIVSLLAAASIGAVWSSVGQDYAAAAAIDRFEQLEPTVLIAADGYRFDGKVHLRSSAVGIISASLPSLDYVLLIERFGATGEAAGNPHAVDPAASGPVFLPWEQAVASAEDVELDLYLPAFDHPLWVLFSSGTTGIPKGLVHGHGGVLLETLKQLGLHWDLRPDDRVFWYTSPSWVMWNFQLSALALGSSVVCYDGSPTYPDPSRLWELASELGVTLFGTSPGFLKASADAGVSPANAVDLSRLRMMGSTGSPLGPHLQQWAHHEVGDVPLWSMSGGTDVAGAFVGGAPTVPIWPGVISVRCLGVAIEAWDANGSPVHCGVGELVVTRPMPSMPISLWNDPDGSKYTQAYFSTYPGVWRQGDWITIFSNGTVNIHGRSDSTLNRHGVRMGSADIYTAIETIDEVTEALVIGAEQPDGDYWMPLFVVLGTGCTLDDELDARIRRAIRENASPRHVPDEVVQVPGIPHTRTGKKLEVPVKRILQGTPISDAANTDAIDDPSLLKPFVDFADARRRRLR